MIERTKLGQLLVEKAIISEEQLVTALEEQKKSGEMLGLVLVRLGFVDQENVYLPILADQLGVDFVNLRDKEIPKETINKIPAKFATHYNIIPIEHDEETITIAMTKPLDVHVIDEISLVINARLKTVLASEKDIAETIRRYYGVGADTIEEMMGSVDANTSVQGDVKDIEDDDSDATISRFLNQILLEAYKDRATDIHIEPFHEELKVRYRVDGVLYDAKVPDNIKHFKDSINSRIKILSNLNIAEKRLPQDGRFKVRVGDIDIDLRVSFLPSTYGESAVLRILSSAKLYSLADLGLAERDRDILETLIKKPHGIIFITGPTGSGKTTTLYSCLSKVNTIDKKIITIEDPIEYQIKGITQIQINPKVGLTFAEGLRSMLRHDPDIMMVGEVRDYETAEIAIRVALTGHLVFSTLHTNDAASSVTRLLDMGVEPFLISSSVECLIAQRLIRVLCPKCKEKTKITSDYLNEFKDINGVTPELEIYEALGCESCRNTGYVGRKAIYEFLIVDDEIKELIVARASANQIKDKAISKGMVTLRQAGWEKVLEGITTPSEVIRITQEIAN